MANYTNTIFEVKAIGDNKRCTDIVMKSLNNTLDVVQFLKAGKNIAYNIILKRTNLKVYTVDGKYVPFNIEGNKIDLLIKDTEDTFYNVIVRDYSNARYAR